MGQNLRSKLHIPWLVPVDYWSGCHYCLYWDTAYNEVKSWRSYWAWLAQVSHLLLFDPRHQEKPENVFSSIRVPNLDLVHHNKMHWSPINSHCPAFPKMQWGLGIIPPAHWVWFPPDFADHLAKGKSPAVFLQSALAEICQYFLKHIFSICNFVLKLVSTWRMSDFGFCCHQPWRDLSIFSLNTLI